MSRGTMPQPGAWPGASCADKLVREAGAASPGPTRAAAREGGKAAAGGQQRTAVRCPAEHEEDMYRDAEEIEKEKELLTHERGLSAETRLSVAPEMDIMDYCKKEWRGNTQKATCMKKGYEEVSQKFTSIRRVRGDNYCALRATLFQAMSQPAVLPSWLQDPELTLLPEKLISRYNWIKHWKLGLKFEGKSEDLVDKIKESLTLLRKKWAGLAELRTAEARQIACDELFTNEEEEYSLYEAVKFLMLNRAIELYDDKEKGKEVPFFSVLLFARDTSNDPQQLLRNHLNQVGHTGGLEQAGLDFTLVAGSSKLGVPRVQSPTLRGARVLLTLMCPNAKGDHFSSPAHSRRTCASKSTGANPFPHAAGFPRSQTGWSVSGGL